MTANIKPMEEMMKVETNYQLITDNGQYLKRGALIYDCEDGHFVGKFLGFNGKDMLDGR